MPVTDVGRLAATCVLVRVDGTVVPLEGAGAAVVLRDVGDQVTAAAAERLSRVLGQVEVAAFRRRDDHVDASTWRGGAQVAAPAAGAALACLPDSAERLVLGADPSAFTDAVGTGSMSRLEAARTAMSGSAAEAAWAARAERWARIARVAVLVLLGTLVVAQLVLTSRGQGSAIVLAISLALFGLLGVTELRRRRSS